MVSCRGWVCGGESEGFGLLQGGEGCVRQGRHSCLTRLRAQAAPCEYAWRVWRAGRNVGACACVYSEHNRCESSCPRGWVGGRAGQRSRPTSMALVSACPMCSEPVTLGGGMTITKGGLPEFRSGLKKPRCCHPSYLPEWVGRWVGEWAGDVAQASQRPPLRVPRTVCPAACATRNATGRASQRQGQTRPPNTGPTRAARLAEGCPSCQNTSPPGMGST